jgi:hypothetical protein
MQREEPLRMKPCFGIAYPRMLFVLMIQQFTHDEVKYWTYNRYGNFLMKLDNLHLNRQQ